MSVVNSTQMRYLMRNLVAIGEKLALSKPRKDEVRNKIRDFLNECERIEVEPRFGLVMRKCGLELTTTKWQGTITCDIAHCTVILNIFTKIRVILPLTLRDAFCYS